MMLKCAVFGPRCNTALRRFP